MSAIIILFGIAIPYTRADTYLGFTTLPALYWPFLGLSVVCYVVLTQCVKMWLLRKQWI